MIRVLTTRPNDAGITADGQHILDVAGVGRIPADLAALTVDGPIWRAANKPLLACLECGVSGSAVEFYADSDVPGECDGCAAGWFGCDGPECQGDHHPDDECPAAHPPECRRDCCS